METTDIRCPECGTINHSLYLEETEGWMECDCCGCTVQLQKSLIALSSKEDHRWQIIRFWPAARLAV